MYQLVLTTQFVRQAKKLLRNNPRLKSRINQTLKLLRTDLKHPSLRLHKLSGLNNWAVSVTSDIRIILHWEQNKLFCLQIGTHDQVY